MSKRRSKNYNTLRNFLCDNRLQQLEVARAGRVSEYTLPTIPVICKRKFFISQRDYSDFFVAFCASSKFKNL